MSIPTNTSFIKFDESPNNCHPRRLSIMQTISQSVDILPYVAYLCDRIPLKNVQFIYGPISYTEHVKDGKRIGIFGESHNVKVNKELNIHDTTTVPSLLLSLLKSNPSKFYDLFLEVEYKKEEYHQISGIKIFDRFFSDCLKIDKEKCLYKNLRAHYIDYRTVMEEFKVFAVKLGNNELEPIHNAEIHILKILRNVQEFIKTDLKLQREIKHVYPQIQLFLNRKFANIMKNIQLLDKEDKHQIRIILPIYSLIMDVYAIGRMFKQFDMSRFKRVYPPGASKNLKKKIDKTFLLPPSTAENCIIYAGDRHAQNYRDFLENEMGFEKIVDIRINENNLLDFTSFKSSSFLFEQEWSDSS